MDEVGCIERSGRAWSLPEAAYAGRDDLVAEILGRHHPTEADLKAAGTPRSGSPFREALMSAVAPRTYARRHLAAAGQLVAAGVPVDASVREMWFIESVPSDPWCVAIGEFLDGLLDGLGPVEAMLGAEERALATGMADFARVFHHQFERLAAALSVLDGDAENRSDARIRSVSERARSVMPALPERVVALERIFDISPSEGDVETVSMGSLTRALAASGQGVPVELDRHLVELPRVCGRPFPLEAALRAAVGWAQSQARTVVRLSGSSENGQVLLTLTHDGPGLSHRAWHTRDCLLASPVDLRLPLCQRLVFRQGGDFGFSPCLTISLPCTHGTPRRGRDEFHIVGSALFRAVSEPLQIPAGLAEFALLRDASGALPRRTREALTTVVEAIGAIDAARWQYFSSNSIR